MAKVGTVIPQYQVAYEGTTVSMDCFSKRKPTWTKDGVSMQGIDGLIVHTLFLYGVTQYDTGVYKCKGTLSKIGLTFTAFSTLFVGGKL